MSTPSTPSTPSTQSTPTPSTPGPTLYIPPTLPPPSYTLPPSKYSPSPLVFFQTVIYLARLMLDVLFRSIVDSDVDGLIQDRIHIAYDLIDCFYSLVRVELTLRFAPQRITPAQIQRLSRAAAAIQALAGHPFDFSPWLSSAENSSGEKSSGVPPSGGSSPSPSSSMSSMSSMSSIPSIPNPQSENPHSENPQSVIHNPQLKNPQSENPQSKNPQSVQFRLKAINTYVDYNNSPRLLNSEPASFSPPKTERNSSPTTFSFPGFRDPGMLRFRPNWIERLAAAAANTTLRAPHSTFRASDPSMSLSMSELFGTGPAPFCSKTPTPGATLARILNTLLSVAKTLGFPSPDSPQPPPDPAPTPPNPNDTIVPPALHPPASPDAASLSNESEKMR